VQIAEAIMKAAKPTGETIVAAYPMLKVIELAAAAHLRDLEQAARFAELIKNGRMSS
jgi:hypothetical protein